MSTSCVSLMVHFKDSRSAKKEKITNKNKLIWCWIFILFLNWSVMIGCDAAEPLSKKKRKKWVLIGKRKAFFLLVKAVTFLGFWKMISSGEKWNTILIKNAIVGAIEALSEADRMSCVAEQSTFCPTTHTVAIWSNKTKHELLCVLYWYYLGIKMQYEWRKNEFNSFKIYSQYPMLPPLLRLAG